VNLSPTGIWLLIGGLVLTTALVKAVGPVFVGGRDLPAPFLRVVALAAPPLLAALVVTNVLADGRELSVGADTVGVAVGGLLLLCRVPLVVSGAVAVAVTAGLRAWV
jgi:branched-subunit amino acid transport protein